MLLVWVALLFTFLDTSLDTKIGFDAGGGGSLQGDVARGGGCGVDQCFVNVSQMLEYAKTLGGGGGAHWISDGLCMHKGRGCSEGDI